MYTRPELGSRLSQRELRRTVENFFKQEFPKGGAGRARELAEAFAEHLTGRAWILREVGLDVFEFTHRTFMEYFFARYLDDTYDSIDDLFAEMLPKVDEWNVASHLAIQLKTREKRASSAKVVDLLLNNIRKARGGACIRLAAFAARTTEYIQPPHEEMRKLVRLTTIKAAEVRGIEILSSFLRSESVIRETILLGMSEGIEELIKESGIPAVAQFVDELAANRAAEYLGEPGKLGASDIDRLLDTGFGRWLKQDQLTSAYNAKLIFDLTGEMPDEAADRFGIELWRDSVKTGNRTDLRCHDFALMAHETLEALHGITKYPSTPIGPYASLAVKIALRAIAQSSQITMKIRHNRSIAKKRLIGLELDPHWTRGPSELVRAAVISLMGCLEVDTDWPVSFYIGGFIDAAIANLMGKCDVTAGFARLWRNGRTTIFAREG
jgi:hypothetical protein